jgi:hypothetical protein
MLVKEMLDLLYIYIYIYIYILEIDKGHVKLTCSGVGAAVTKSRGLQALVGRC